MARCGDCGFDNSEAANFCGGCGRKLHESLMAEQPALSPSGALQNGAAVEIQVENGSLRLVTVMFADVQASFETVRDQDPEQTRAFLNRVLTVIRDSVTEAGGTIAQVAGDGVMALFGAPVALEDHAVRACHAALAMHEGMARLADTGGLAPRLRIGLNSGPVLVGTYGHDNTFGYSAIGATTFMAARMEQIAVPGSTRLSRATLSLAEGYVRASSMGDCVVKGVGTVETFVLVDKTATPALQVRMSRGTSRFTGRADELEAIRAALVDPARLTTVRLAGEPGVGKSRLVFEALGSVAETTILRAEGLAHESSPFGSLVRALKGYLGVGDRDGAQEVADKLQNLLQGFDLQTMRVPLHALLDLPQKDPVWAELDPAQRRQGMFRALRALIDAAAGSAGLVLVFDDLQWFDTQSRDALEYLVGTVKARLTLVAIHRSDWTPPVLNFDWDHEIEVAPLSEHAATTLLGELMGEHPSCAPLRDRILERTYGNPLFMEETVRSMAEEGAIVGEAGAYELADPSRVVAVPASVESVIAARIDRLPVDLRLLLTRAAVLGADFSANLLAEMSGESLQVVAHATQQLVSADMLSLRQTTPQPEYGFRHVTIRDVLYGSLLRETKSEIHARATRALEATYGDRLAEHLDALAVHSYNGELWAETAGYQLAASVRAVAGSANRHAIVCIERGLTALARLGDAPGAARLGIDMRLAALAAHMPLGNMDETLALVHEAREIASSTGDQRRLGAVHSQVATASWYTANYDDAFEAAERAMEIATTEGDKGLQMRAAYNLGMVYHARGDFTRTIEMFARLIDGIGESERHRRYGWVGYPESFCRAFKASSLTYLGEFEAAIECFSPGIELADRVAHPYSQTLLREELGFCYIEMGRFVDAIDVLQEALATAEEQEVATMIAPTTARLAMALCRAGRYADAVAYLDRVEERESWRAAATYGRNFLVLAQVEVSLCQGNVDLALRRATAVEAATSASAEHNHGFALVAMAQAGLQSGATASALKASDDAVTFAESRGMRPLLARARHTKALVLDALGDAPGSMSERRAVFDLADLLGVSPSAFGSEGL